MTEYIVCRINKMTGTIKAQRTKLKNVIIVLDINFQYHEKKS